MKTGAELIADERQRQIVEKRWTSGHDDNEHEDGGLALAGAVYALDVVTRIGNSYIVYPPLKRAISEVLYSGWPWDKIFWKPTPDNDIRELTKAGALIAAEIDRLQRQKQVKQNGKYPLKTGIHSIMPIDKLFQIW
jgi:hypothetical protein